MDPENTASDTGFDVDAAVNDISGSMGFEKPETNGLQEIQTELPLDTPTTIDSTDVNSSPNTKSESSQNKLKTMPKSWAKDKESIWSKLPPDAQEYYEVREKQFLDGLEQYKGDATYAKQLKDIISPYKPILASQGVTESQAVQYLMNAHYRLTQGSPQERQAAYAQIGKDLGIVSEPSDQITDPAVRQLQNELNGIKSTLSSQQQAALQSVQAETAREVETFKADPAHAYFDEVSPDMVILINGGASLADAYEKAVWANPVTRQKELTRLQTEGEAKLKEKARAEAEAARKTTSTNVRGVESRKAPTEPLGSMEDTMRDTLSKIKNRAH